MGEEKEEEEKDNSRESSPKPRENAFTTLNETEKAFSGFSSPHQLAI